MIFLPEKSNVGGGLILADAGINLFILVLFINISHPSARAMLLLLFLTVNIILFRFIILSLTIKYKMVENEIRIAGMFNVPDRRIPFNNIISFQRRITFSDFGGIRGVKGDRFAFGNGTDEKGKHSEYFVTDSRKIMVLYTKDQNIWISPEDSCGISDFLKSRGITERELVRENTQVQEESSENDKTKLNELIKYTIITVIIFTLLPVLLFRTGVLPYYVKSVIFPDAGIILTSDRYIKGIIINAAVTVIVIIMAFAAALSLHRVDGKYHYRIMFIPMAVSVFFLFREISMILLSLTGS